MADPLGVADSFDERRADADRALGLVGLEHRGVVVGTSCVEVNAVEIDEIGEPAQDDLVPLAPAVLAAVDELDGGICSLHHRREGPRLLDVVVGVQVADLPAPVHLVPEAPVPDAVRLGVAVLPAQGGPRGVAGAVAVLHPRLGLVHGPRAHVHADEGRGLDLPAVLDELVRPEAV